MDRRHVAQKQLPLAPQPANNARRSLNVTYAADTTDLSASIAEIASGQAEVSNIGVSGTLFDELAQGLVDDIQWMENRVETYSTWYAWVSFGVSTFIGLLILPFIFGVLLAIQGSVKPGLVKVRLDEERKTSGAKR